MLRGISPRVRLTFFEGRASGRTFESLFGRAAVGVESRFRSALTEELSAPDVSLAPMGGEEEAAQGDHTVLRAKIQRNKQFHIYCFLTQLNFGQVNVGKNATFACIGSKMVMSQGEFSLPSRFPQFKAGVVVTATV